MESLKLVYLIGDGKRQKYYKIGITKDWAERQKFYRTAIPKYRIVYMKPDLYAVEIESRVKEHYRGRRQIIEDTSRESEWIKDNLDSIKKVIKDISDDLNGRHDSEDESVSSISPTPSDDDQMLVKSLPYNTGCNSQEHGLTIIKKFSLTFEPPSIDPEFMFIPKHDTPEMFKDWYTKVYQVITGTDEPCKAKRPAEFKTYLNSIYTLFKNNNKYSMLEYPFGVIFYQEALILDADLHDKYYDIFELNENDITLIDKYLYLPKVVPEGCAYIFDLMMLFHEKAFKLSDMGYIKQENKYIRQESILLDYTKVITKLQDMCEGDKYYDLRVSKDQLEKLMQLVKGTDIEIQFM